MPAIHHAERSKDIQQRKIPRLRLGRSVRREAYRHSIAFETYLSSATTKLLSVSFVMCKTGSDDVFSSKPVPPFDLAVRFFVDVLLKLTPLIACMKFNITLRVILSPIMI